ncbi:hypothetical protein B0H17DRAFT_1144838 [Mycena rosella]|uniref:Uncharacterized protein n=1 Tax=Mycena rosella TaxID=1033263 RepID=A0AAD7CS60_MYCRO|nr:hypothetical protein B0H17DRAFT_1144838 [Mycena rosella]
MTTQATDPARAIHSGITFLSLVPDMQQKNTRSSWDRWAAKRLAPSGTSLMWNIQLMGRRNTAQAVELPSRKGPWRARGVQYCTGTAAVVTQDEKGMFWERSAATLPEASGAPHRTHERRSSQAATMFVDPEMEAMRVEIVERSTQRCGAQK